MEARQLIKPFGASASSMVAGLMTVFWDRIGDQLLDAIDTSMGFVGGHARGIALAVLVVLSFTASVLVFAAVMAGGDD